MTEVQEPMTPAGADGDTMSPEAGETVRPTTGQKVGIWIVGGYFVLTAAGGLVSLFLLAGRAVPVSTERLEFVNSLPQALFFAGFVNLFLNLSGGVFLLMRRRIALPFLLGGAAAKLVSTVFAPLPSTAEMSTSMYAAAVIGEWLLLAAALAYVASLWRHRLLEA